MLKQASYFLLLLLVIFSACSRPLQETTYMYNIQADSIYPDGPVPDEYEVRVNDQLYIQVISDDKENAVFLNLNPVDKIGGSGNMELITYIVDENGDIYFLLLGKIHVVGYTVKEIREKLQLEVDRYLENTSVFVKLVNRYITILGEVENPGQHHMDKSRLSIFEAIGTAGDITDWGKFSEVRLIRETPEGKLVANIDLTNPNLINSPYYYILPNDVLYVSLNGKVLGNKFISVLQPIYLTLSVITTALLVYGIFK
ncbi:MAG: polysaccharide biosynthesis/export family protein [Bacteroidetes bacterium]|nr:polysaccharide biosynthesis/export family protein [Bacteroidota bacterium]